MRRKYDLRNKRNFIIILILSIAIICIFSLFIYRYTKSSRIMYTVEAGSIIQDVNKNFINIDEDAILKIRWNDSYYLTYQDQKINLGKKVIIYNAITGSMKLYGRFYEILEDGKITEYKDETVLANTTDTKFYKIDDREYLLVDRQIVSDDRNTQADNYLLVELDKMGNAKLSNYKLNLKTINPTKLVTSKYSFDIANEILKYGSLEIDLKKIIGSTNQYVSDGKSSMDGTETESDGNGTGNGTGSVGSGDGNGLGTGGGVGSVINNTDKGDVTDIGEIKDKTKMTSIVRVLEGLTQIDVDYVIYDPYNEYKSVYAEIVKYGEIEVVYLSKTDTHMVFDNLLANTEYKINFIYTTADSETGEIIPNKFDEMTLKTKMPVYSISIYKISNVSKTLTYRVNLQENYQIDNVNVNLSFNYRSFNTETGEAEIKTASIDSSVAVTSGAKSVMGVFDISGYDIDQDTLLRLKINSVSGINGTLDIDSSYTFRFGR